MITNNLIQSYLQEKKIVGVPLQDYIIQNDNDGKGVYISYWNKDKLGTQPTESDLQYFIFIEAQQQATKIVDNIYFSNNTWLFTIKDNTSSLTALQDWFLTKLSTKPIFFDNKNIAQQKELTIQQVFDIKDKINNLGFQIKSLQYNLTIGIRNTTTQKALSKYTQEYIQNEFNKIDKTIIIE